MLVTDVQVHLWEPERPDRPWPQPQQRPPHRPNGFSGEEMLNEMDAAGVDRAVIVPPTWAGESNEWALDVAARYPKRFAVVGRFDVNPPDARRQLEGWLKQPHMLGVRMSFHVKPFIDWLEDGSLDWFWATCEQYAIPVMALVPGMPGKIRPTPSGTPLSQSSFRISVSAWTLAGRRHSRASMSFWRSRAIPALSSTCPACRIIPTSGIRSGILIQSSGASTTPSDRGGCCGEPTSVGCAAPTEIVLPSSKRNSTSFRRMTRNGSSENHWRMC